MLQQVLRMRINQLETFHYSILLNFIKFIRSEKKITELLSLSMIHSERSRLSAEIRLSRFGTCRMINVHWPNIEIICFPFSADRGENHPMTMPVTERACDNSDAFAGKTRLAVKVTWHDTRADRATRADTWKVDLRHSAPSFTHIYTRSIKDAANASPCDTCVHAPPRIDIATRAR
jgi:hypothetical protein